MQQSAPAPTPSMYQPAQSNNGAKASDTIVSNHSGHAYHQTEHASSTDLLDAVLSVGCGEGGRFLLQPIFEPDEPWPTARPAPLQRSPSVSLSSPLPRPVSSLAKVADGRPAPTAVARRDDKKQGEEKQPHRSSQTMPLTSSPSNRLEADSTQKQQHNHTVRSPQVQQVQQPQHQTQQQPQQKSQPQPQLKSPPQPAPQPPQQPRQQSQLLRQQPRPQSDAHKPSPPPQQLQQPQTQQLQPHQPHQPHRQAAAHLGPAAKQPRAVAHGEHKQSTTATITRTSRGDAPEDGLVTTTLSTVLRQDEIESLRRFHDNSLALNSHKAYQSDYQSFIRFLSKRFPTIPEPQIQQQCTLEHVLAYLNQLCNDGKTISTINRRLSTIKKHILPTLFTSTIVTGSREELIHREMDAIVRGIRRTVGAEQGVRGKRPLLIEQITDMCKAASSATTTAGVMPNTQCRDVCLLLFLFYSAMRRNEVVRLMWNDLTFDARGVLVRIRQSKTDKEATGQTIGISRLDDTDRAAFCPVKALEAWRTASQGVGESPVFRWISKKDEIQWRVLIDQRIVAIIKRYAGLIGLDATCFAAHSTRSGYVTSSSDRGVPISEMMKRTRHKSISSLSVYMKGDELFQGSGDRRLRSYPVDAEIVCYH